MGMRDAFRAMDACILKIISSSFFYLALSKLTSCGVFTEAANEVWYERSTQHSDDAKNGSDGQLACDASFSHVGALCMTVHRPGKREYTYRLYKYKVIVSLYVPHGPLKLRRPRKAVVHRRTQDRKECFPSRAAARWGTTRKAAWGCEMGGGGGIIPRINSTFFGFALCYE